MRRQKQFLLRLSEEEKAMVAAVADGLQRSQSDALRLLLRGAAREFEAADSERMAETNQPRAVVNDAITPSNTGDL
jgi:hypothetical protein